MNKIVSDSTSFNNKDYLVEEFSLRWNYVLPVYPPVDYKYGKELQKYKLNLVASE